MIVQSKLSVLMATIFGTMLVNCGVLNTIDATNTITNASVAAAISSIQPSLSSAMTQYQQAASSIKALPSSERLAAAQARISSNATNLDALSSFFATVTDPAVLSKYSAFHSQHPTPVASVLATATAVPSDLVSAKKSKKSSGFKTKMQGLFKGMKHKKSASAQPTAATA